MSSNINETAIENDNEITLKDLILKVQEFYKEIFKNWLIIFLFIIPFLGFFLFKAFTTPDKYSASLTFMINEDEGGGIGGAMAILSQFGFGGGGKSKYNLDKILDLSTSRKIVQQTLFEKISIDGKEDFVANHIIELYDFHDKWKKAKNGLKGFKFTHGILSDFTLVENAAFLSTYKKIIGGKNVEGLISKSIKEETGIMTLSSSTVSEQLSIHLVESIYTHLSIFYIEKTTEKQKVTYEIVSTKVDSIKNEIEKLDYSLASFKDSNRGIFTKKSGLKEQQMKRNIQVLTLLYGEALKNLEIADFTLRNKTPFIQSIDYPLAPLDPEQQSKAMAVLLSCFIGGFIAVIFIIGRKVLRETMKENSLN